MNELNYILKRILQIIPVLFIVTIVIFVMIRLIPGDPALAMLGEKGSIAAIEAMRHKMGLDKPLIVQYFIFLNNLLHFNLGTSSYYNVPVISLILQKIVITLSLTVVSTILTLLISFPLGYIAGVNGSNYKSRIINAVSLITISLPSFWVGLLLIILFGLKLAWFPVAGWGDTWPQHLYSLVLPGFTQ